MTNSHKISQTDNHSDDIGEKKSTKSDKLKYSSFDAPTLKDFLWVIAVFALLVAFSWIAYFKLGWFH